jgi:hypothetical protein
MVRRFREPARGSNSFSNPEGWLSDFADMIALPFAAPDFKIQKCSNHFQWLAEPLTSDEIQATLQLCNNSSAGLDGIKFNLLLKNLPDRGKEMLLELYSQIFSAETCPESWRETKVVSILKPGKVRKLFEKMICTRLDYWAEEFEILSPSQFGFRKGDSWLSFSVEFRYTHLFRAEKENIGGILGYLWGIRKCVDRCPLWQFMRPPAAIGDGSHSVGSAAPKEFDFLSNCLNGLKVWKFDLDKLKEQFFYLLQQNILIKTIWSSTIFIWCAHKPNIRDFFFKIFNTFNFFKFFKILIAWTGLISSLIYTSGFIVQRIRESLQKSLDAVSVFYPIWAFP